MSKPNSGHFQGTTGSNNSGSAPFTNPSASDIIAERVKGLDLRPHPTKYKQPSSKKLKGLREKEKNRTITRQEYELLDWSRRFSKRRSKGVAKFLREERRRIRKGLPTTRNWSAEQKKDILQKKHPKYNGQSMQFHHTYPAAIYPHLADKHEIIFPATRREHIEGWHGENTRNYLPGKPIKPKTDF